MIKVSKVENKDGITNTLASLSKLYLKKIENLIYKGKNPEERLNSILNSYKKLPIAPDRQEKIELLDDLIKDYNKLINGSVIELDKLIKKYNSKGYAKLLINNKKNQTFFGKKISKVFNYKKFRSSDVAVWLARELNFKACPYCNAQYILSYDKTEIPTKWYSLFVKTPTIRSTERALFEYDHFFPKSIYPYLGLSFYNLIPSCKPCNNKKLNTDTNIKGFVHPYHRSFHDIFEYDCDDKNTIDYILGNKKIKNLEISIKPRNKHYPKQKERILQNHLDNFDLGLVAQQHKDVIEDLFYKHQYYNPSRRNELKNIKIKGTNKSLFDDEILGRFVLGNYSMSKDINKRPLSKMMQDIGNKLDLI